MSQLTTNEILEELRNLFATPKHTTAQRMRLAELFNLLDGWLMYGGRLPDDWADAVRPQLRSPTQTHLCPVCEKIHPLPLCVRASKDDR